MSIQINSWYGSATNRPIIFFVAPNIGYLLIKKAKIICLKKEEIFGLHRQMTFIISDG